MLHNDSDKTFESRFIIIILAFGLLATALFFRLLDLQIVNRVFYKSLAQGQHDVSHKLPAIRGKIFLRDRGSDALYPVATNRTVYILAVSPRFINNLQNAGLEKEKVAAALAPYAALEASAIMEKMNNPEEAYKVLAQNIKEADAKKIQMLKLPGVILEAQSKRYYPEKTLGGQLLGFLTY